MRQDPGSGCQLRQEAWRLRQMGKGGAEALAELEAGSQHCGQRQMGGRGRAPGFFTLGLSIGWALGTTVGFKNLGILHHCHC